MRILRFALLTVLSFLSVPLAAQSPPPRDPQAVAVLQRSFAAMGGRIPSDSVATGRISLVEGSLQTNGWIRLLTRGLDQALEEITVPEGSRKAAYSRGLATSETIDERKKHSAEWAANGQASSSPLIVVAAALANSDGAFEYLGTETIEGQPAHHLRFWSTFGSYAEVAHLAEFSVREIWIDATSGFPVRLSFVQRSGQGTALAVRVDVRFSDYRNTGGILYPFRIEESLNGTPWATTTIENLRMNTGLSEAEFSLR